MSTQLSAEAPDHRGVIDTAIEYAWLGALALVPLVFSDPDLVIFFLQPKHFVLHFVSLFIVALWGFEWALGINRPGFSPPSISGIRRWLGRNPRNWALIAAAGFGVSAMISTLLSPLPIVSLWGRDFRELGYELYSLLSLLVIFFAIAVRVRDGAQVKRILWVIAIVGTLAALYGITQRYGWDPIGDGAGDVRVISSFSNPIFFGSYLVMSVIVTLGLALSPASDKRRWLLPTIAVMFGLQLAGMWFTGSRGPWIGLISGLGAFGLLGVITFDRQRALYVATVFLAGLLIALVVINAVDTSHEVGGRGLDSIVSGLTPAAEGLGRRSDIWQGSVRLLDSWERQESDSQLASTLKPVFGLGPEMYRYSYPLTANPQSGLSFPSHAHNLPLQLVLELGLLGLVTFMALAILVLVAGVTFIRSRGRISGESVDWFTIAMVTVVAGLVGRGFEQMVGVARIADLVPFWVLLGVVLAIHGIGSGVKAENPIGRGVNLSQLRLGIAAAVAAALLVIFITRDVQQWRSGIAAANGFEQHLSGNDVDAINSMGKAARLSPDVAQYGVWQSELLIFASRTQSDSTAASNLLALAYSTLIQYENRDRFNFTSQFAIGTTLAEMVLRGDDSRREEIVERWVRIADVLSTYPEVQAAAAQKVLIADAHQLGLELADRSLAMEQATSPNSFAWFLRGDALQKLGDGDGALEAFAASLERDPDGDYALAAHRSSAFIQDSLGNPALASEHRLRADEIERSR